MSKYLICGKGTVGSAFGNALETWGHEVEYYDPPKGLGFGNIGEEYVGAFICAPTPTEHHHGYTQDLSAVLDCLGLCEDRVKTPWVSIRSTVDPRRVDELLDFYDGGPVIAHPEFLREKHAFAESLSPEITIVGGDSKLLDQYLDTPLHTDVIFKTTIKNAFLFKYAANILFANKVVYANIIKKMFQENGDGVENLPEVLHYIDKKFAGRHMNPEHGEKPGFGGKCLPKDTRLWYNQGYELIDSIVDINDELRG